MGHEQDAGYVTQTLTYMKEHPGMVLPIVFLLAMGENLAVISLALPATAILAAASFVFAASRTNPWPLALVAGTGAAIGFAVSYWCGVWFHEPIMHTSIMQQNAGSVQKVHDFFEKWGVLGVFLSHFSGPLRAFVSLVAGMIEMNHLQFQVANIAGAYIWGVGMMAPVFAVHYAPEAVVAWVSRHRVALSWGIATVVLVSIGVYALRH